MGGHTPRGRRPPPPGGPSELVALGGDFAEQAEPCGGLAKVARAPAIRGPPQPRPGGRGVTPAPA